MYTTMPCSNVTRQLPLLKMSVVSLFDFLILKLISIQDDLFISLFRFLDNLAMQWGQLRTQPVAQDGHDLGFSRLSLPRAMIADMSHVRPKKTFSIIQRPMGLLDVERLKQEDSLMLSITRMLLQHKIFSAVRQFHKIFSALSQGPVPVTSCSSEHFCHIQNTHSEWIVAIQHAHMTLLEPWFQSDGCFGFQHISVAESSTLTDFCHS